MPSSEAQALLLQAFIIQAAATPDTSTAFRETQILQERQQLLQQRAFCLLKTEEDPSILRPPAYSTGRRGAPCGSVMPTVER